MPELTKKVDGKRVPLTEAEVADFEARQEAHEAKKAAEAAAKPLNDCYAARTANVADGGYGTIQEQLEMIGEQGYDAFQAHIQAVKAAHPKPE